MNTKTCVVKDLTARLVIPTVLCFDLDLKMYCNCIPACFNSSPQNLLQLKIVMRGEFYSFYFNVRGILFPQALQTLSKLILSQTKHSKEKKNQVVSYATWLQLYNLLTLGKSCIKKTLKSVKEKV